MSRTRLGLLIPWALFAAFCICWSGYWFYAKDAAVKALDAAIAQANAKGIRTGYFRARASGFPLRLTITLEAFRIRAMPTLSISATTLPVTVNLSNPRHFMFGLADGLRWETGEFENHKMTVRRGEMSLRLDRSNALARASLALEGVRVVHSGEWLLEPVTHPTTEIDTLLVHLRPDPRNGADAQLIVDATGWNGPTPIAALKGLSPFAHFRTAVVVTDYATLATKTPFASWRGALRVERLDVAYAGTDVTGEGMLDLDDQHRVTGELTLTPAGGSPVALVAAEGWWTFAGLRVARAKPVYTPSPPD